MRLLTVILLSSLVSVQSAWGDDITLMIGEHKIRAVIANTPDSRERGLMYKTSLCENCGMLFIFPVAREYSFWMKNTPLPLSIAFIASDGSILNIVEMKAYSTNSYSAQGNALFALEMNKDWFIQNKIKSRELVKGLDSVPLGQ